MAVVAILGAVIAVVIGFYRERSRAAFKLKSEHTKLSTDVVSEVSGYERLETENGVARYLIKADHAKTFSDNHLELSNVYLELYDGAGTVDKMSAESALYIPEEAKNFHAYLKGSVRIETSEALIVNAADLSYSRASEIAEVSEALDFEREAVRGKSFGATVRMAEKRLELLRDVELEIFDSPELLKSNVRYAKVNSGTATFDQIANKFDLTGGVSIAAAGADRRTDLRAQRAVVDMAGGDSGNAKRVRTIELTDQVNISINQPGTPETSIASGSATYDKPADRFELRNAVHIVTSAADQPTDIRAGTAIYEQARHQMELTAAEITQSTGWLKGDTITARLFPDRRIRSAVVRGNAAAKQTSPDRTLDLTAPELNAEFNDARQLRDANAIGSSRVELIPANKQEYTSVLTTAASGIGIVFNGDGLLGAMRTDGRTTVQLNAPPGQPDAANKRVTADAVRTIFAANGKDISKAEAVGNAELFIEPLTASRNNYRTTINAPRFDCEFFPSGNNARDCTAAQKAKAVRVPTVKAEGRGAQTIAGDVLVARFSQATSDIDRLEAKGSSKFTELDRNGVADEMTFTQADDFVRLRGNPTVWDSRGRARAREIDLDTVNDRSSLRGSVSTTYYSQKQINSSTPFGSSDKPVFLTAENADFDHAGETAVYSGNARGWQESNYVRADKLVLDQRRGTLSADGNVQSLLSNARIRARGKTTSVPISASAMSMNFDRNKNILQYRRSVDIRQGTDRITAGSADVFLTPDNDIVRTVAETDVTITQPNRRASGSWVQYSADDEIAILRGDPATVTDQVNGSSQASQLTLSLKDNSVVAEGSKKQSPASGRIRSVYKIKDLKP